MRKLTRFLAEPTDVVVERGIMFFLVEGHDCDFCMSVHDALVTAHKMLTAASMWERDRQCEVIQFKSCPPG